MSRYNQIKCALLPDNETEMMTLYKNVSWRHFNKTLSKQFNRVIFEKKQFDF